MDNDEKPFRKAIQKAIASSPERQKLEAHLEALEQEQQRRRAARGEPEPVIIDTGVPRQPCEEGCRCWRHSPAEPYDAAAEREKDRLAAKQLESPNAPPRRKPPPPEPAPPPPSREWRYCYVQVRGPRDGDCGMILDGMYAVSDGLLWWRTREAIRLDGPNSNRAMTRPPLRGACCEPSTKSNLVLRDFTTATSAVPGHITKASKRIPPSMASCLRAQCRARPEDAELGTSCRRCDNMFDWIGP